MRPIKGIRAWLRRDQLHRDLHKELQFHVDAHARDLMASGVSPDEAARLARLALGGVAQTAERVIERRADAAVDHLVHDLREAVRSLRRTPGLTVAVVTLIALVIGGNTTVFSVIHGILTKPAPGVRAERLVTIDLLINGRPFDGGNSYPNYVDYAAQSTTVHPLIVDSYGPFTLTTPDGSYAIRGDQVSSNYFDTLGVQPILGRVFRDADDRADTAALPAVVSERPWRRQFASAADLVGQPIALNGHAATIIGVAPPRFAGTVTGETADVWVPFLPYSKAHGAERELNDRSRMVMGIFGRLTPGVSLAQARTEFAVISQRLRTAYPDVNAGQVAFPIAYSAIATGSLLSRQRRRSAAHSAKWTRKCPWSPCA